jgi:hypothetical protein
LGGITSGRRVPGTAAVRVLPLNLAAHRTRNLIR